MSDDYWCIEGILDGDGFRQTNGNQFAEWLAAHDAEVAAKALEDAADEMDSLLRYPDSPSFNAADHTVNRATVLAADRLRARAAGIREGAK